MASSSSSSSSHIQSSPWVHLPPDSLLLQVRGDMRIMELVVTCKMSVLVPDWYQLILFISDQTVYCVSQYVLRHVRTDLCPWGERTEEFTYGCSQALFSVLIYLLIIIPFLFIYQYLCFYKMCPKPKDIQFSILFGKKRRSPHILEVKFKECLTIIAIITFVSLSFFDFVNNQMGVKLSKYWSKPQENIFGFEFSHRNNEQLEP